MQLISDKPQLYVEASMLKHKFLIHVQGQELSDVHL